MKALIVFEQDLAMSLAAVQRKKRGRYSRIFKGHDNQNAQQQKGHARVSGKAQTQPLPIDQGAIACALK